MERSDDTILGPKAMADHYGVKPRALMEMVRQGRAPMPMGGMKPPFRWRWGAVKKWHEAMETLYGVAFALPKIDEKRREATESDESEQNSTGDKNAPGTPRKRR